MFAVAQPHAQGAVRAIICITAHATTLVQQPPSFQAQFVQPVQVIVTFVAVQVHVQHAAQDIDSILASAMIPVQQLPILLQQQLVQVIFASYFFK